MKHLPEILLTLRYLIVAVVLSSCATLTSDITIETHAHPQINYSAYKTYAWAGSAEIVFDPVGQWEQPTLDTDEEVRFVINRELRSRGINQVASSPDLLVSFAAGVDTSVMELNEDPQTHDKVLSEAPKSALVIALTDASTGYLVWLGYATADAQQQQSIETIRVRIDYAVSQIFNYFDNDTAF